MILLKHATLSHKSRSVNDLWIGIKQTSRKLLRWGIRMYVQLVCTSEVPRKQVWHSEKDLLLFFNYHVDFLKKKFNTQWLIGMCVLKFTLWFSFLELFFKEQANRWRHQFCQSQKTRSPGLQLELCMMGLQIRARED